MTPAPVSVSEPRVIHKRANRKHAKSTASALLSFLVSMAASENVKSPKRTRMYSWYTNRPMTSQISTHASMTRYCHLKGVHA